MMLVDYHKARIAHAQGKEGVPVVGNTPGSRSAIYALLPQHECWGSALAALMGDTRDGEPLAAIDVCPIAPEALQPGEEGGIPHPRLIVWRSKMEFSGPFNRVWHFDEAGLFDVIANVCL